MSEITYVWVDAADGPVLVVHTREQLDALWHGMDREVAVAMSEPETKEKP